MALVANIFEPIKAMSRVTDRVIVAYSGGKDSAVTLDLCCRYFKDVRVFFMYQIPGLSFQEATIRWAEQKYGVTVERIPHFELSNFMRYGVFRKPDMSVPIISPRDVYQYERVVNDVWWIAAGERIADSIVRRAMMKKSGSIDVNRGRFYPVSLFTKADIQAYISHRKLKVSPESVILGHSFRSLHPEDMAKVKEHYPDDYRKILDFFPFAEAAAMLKEMQDEDATPAI